LWGGKLFKSKGDYMLKEYNVNGKTVKYDDRAKTWNQALDINIDLMRNLTGFIDSVRKSPFTLLGEAIENENIEVIVALAAMQCDKLYNESSYFNNLKEGHALSNSDKPKRKYVRKAKVE
jgi:hypothetical protein